VNCYTDRLDDSGLLAILTHPYAEPPFWKPCVLSISMEAALSFLPWSKHKCAKDVFPISTAPH
jgi:hypothetical protein